MSVWIPSGMCAVVVCVYVCLCVFSSRFLPVNTGWWEIDIHGCYSLVKIAFARAKTIDEYDVTMLVPRYRVTSQINCDDVTMLSQNGQSLATIAKWANDVCL